MSGSEQHVPKFLNIILILKGQLPQGGYLEREGRKFYNSKESSNGNFIFACHRFLIQL